VPKAHVQWVAFGHSRCHKRLHGYNDIGYRGRSDLESNVLAGSLVVPTVEIVKRKDLGHLRVSEESAHFGGIAEQRNFILACIKHRQHVSVVDSWIH